MPLNAALTAIHDPETMAQAKQAQHRLRYEEAFVLQAALLRRPGCPDAAGRHPTRGASRWSAAGL
jgi:ATP-dependent DNA helicase RecG